MVTNNLKYDVTGKITGIYADAALTQLKLSFGYDENGNRITRTDYTGTTPQTTYTVYDASGNPLAIYNNTTQAEIPIYGSERLGTYSPTFNSYAYELRDNVGSVRVVISNTKTSTGQANVFTYNDYYPFGSTARSGGITYRYEYQGAYAEKDPITGFNNFDLRMYDGRIGRWLSTDPNAQYYSPYVGMGNNPVNRVDPDGGYDTEEAAQQAAKAAGVDPSTIYNNGGNSGWGYNTSIENGIVGHFGPSNVGGNFNSTWQGPDWRGIGEASLAVLGGGSEIGLALGAEYFTGGLATPLATVAIIDGSTRASFGMVKLMAAVGGQKEARNIPGSVGALVGMSVDRTMGTKNGQQIGSLVNDAVTIGLTGGTGANISTLLSSGSVGTKVFTVFGQVGVYSDALSAGGVYDRKK